MQLQHIFWKTDFFSSHQLTYLQKQVLRQCYSCFGLSIFVIYFGTINIIIWFTGFSVFYFGNGRWVSWPKLFPSSEARKATKCLLCCWSAAQFFSYVNAVICRWMWWILTSSDEEESFQLSSVVVDRSAHPWPCHDRRKLRTLLWAARVCVWPFDQRDGRRLWMFINRTVVTPQIHGCLHSQPTQMVVSYLQQWMMSAFRERTPPLPKFISY